MGKPGFPIPLRTGCARPHLPAGGSRGKPGFPIPMRESQVLPRAGAWGNQVPPRPCARAAPAHTFPRAGGWGNPVSPSPCARAAPAHTFPRAGVWGNLVPPGSRYTRWNWQSRMVLLISTARQLHTGLWRAGELWRCGTEPMRCHQGESVLDLLAAVGRPTGSGRAALAAPRPNGHQERWHSETIVLAVRAAHRGLEV